MIEYSYICEKCEVGFSVLKNRSDYQEREPCPQCKRKKNVIRNFQADLPTGVVHLHISEVKTVGHLAARNGEKMSQDEQDERWLKDNAYKAPPLEKELPSGCSRIRKELIPPSKRKKLKEAANRKAIKIIKKGS